ncbi:MAG: hypothetical protein IPP71_03945 [Bacteroidetes bacterium]|nr:hypothetical protein [Bacteroidota bacterium]
MKYVVAFLYFLNLFDAAHAQLVNDEASFFNGKYDKSQIVSKQIENVKISMSAANELYSIQTFYFDVKGLLTRQTIADSSGRINAEFRFKYNSYDDLIQRIQRDYTLNSLDTVIFTKFYWDSLLIKETSNQPPLTNEYFYDSAKNRVKSVASLVSNNSFVYKYALLNAFDSLGRIIQIKRVSFANELDSIGTIVSNRKLSYGANGKIAIDFESINNGDSYISNNGTKSYRYNKNESLVEVIDTKGTRTKYKYNNEELITTKELILNIQDSKTVVIDNYTYSFRK